MPIFISLIDINIVIYSLSMPSVSWFSRGDILSYFMVHVLTEELVEGRRAHQMHLLSNCYFIQNSVHDSIVYICSKNYIVYFKQANIKHLSLSLEIVKSHSSCSLLCIVKVLRH